jgi:DNA-binding transcriptional regulator GbsR (MarR family)
MTRSLGRVYGYALLSPEPVDIEKIASNLEVSRSPAWEVIEDAVEKLGAIQLESRMKTTKRR